MEKISKETNINGSQINRPADNQKKENPNALIRNFDQFMASRMQSLKRETTHIQNHLRSSGEKLRAIPVSIRQDILFVSSLFFAIIYILICFPLMKIARKLNIRHAWLAWIPVIQIFLYIKMADKSMWHFLWLLIPVIGIFVMISLWMNILNRIQKPSWLGIFLVIPGLNIFILWYLAVSSTRYSYISQHL